MSHLVRMDSQLAKVETGILHRVCEAIGSPRALTVYLLAKHGEFNQLASLPISSLNYDDASSFADDYLVTKMLSKSRAQPQDQDLEKAAYAKWCAAERQCAETNDRLESYFEKRSVNPTDPRVNSVIARAIQLIDKTLGRLTRRSLDIVAQEADFGPGATTSVAGGITRGRKFANDFLTTTSRLLSVGLFCLPSVWKKRIKGFTLRESNKLTFVDKTFKEKRTITIENDLNIFIQKGIGKLLRRRLENLGLFLEKQQQRNRLLAKLSAKLGLATVDLSSASDTIACLLVRYFLPHEWFELLYLARPDYSSYKGDLIKLEKFSGMGNGYTFELETLIFHCLQLAVCHELKLSTEHVTTFGDDMILPIEGLELLKSTLNFLGFSVNSEKSFGKGRFHESCGEDYFDETNVRPFFLRSKPEVNTNVQSYYLYCNLIRSYAFRRNSGYGCDSRFLPAWLFVHSRIPKRHRHFVPNFEYESGGIVGNLDEATPRWTNRDGICGWNFHYIRRDPVKTRRYLEGSYIGALASKRSTDFSHGLEPVRGRLKEPKTKTGFIHEWIDLGPWC